MIGKIFFRKRNLILRAERPRIGRPEDEFVGTDPFPLAAHFRLHRYAAGKPIVGIVDFRRGTVERNDERVFRIFEQVGSMDGITDFHFDRHLRVDKRPYEQTRDGEHDEADDRCERNEYDFPRFFKSGFIAEKETTDRLHPFRRFIRSENFRPRDFTHTAVSTLITIFQTTLHRSKVYREIIAF